MHQSISLPPVRFVGTGGAFDSQWANSALVAQHAGRRLLIDCGHTVFPRLQALEATEGLLATIDEVLLTHLHDDHAGSLSTLLFYRHFVRPDRPRLVVRCANEAFRQTVLGYLRYSMGPAEQFADFCLLDDPALPLPGISALDTTGLHYPQMPTFAFVFEPAGAQAADAPATPPWAFSGDLGHPDWLFAALCERGLAGCAVLHDCSWIHTPAHAHYQALAKHLPTFRIWGYHHNPDLRPSDCRVPIVTDEPALLLGNGIPRA